MYWKATAFSPFLIASALAQAPRLSIDKLDATEGLPMPPANIVIVDAFVDVAPDDYWTAGGVSAHAQNGARFAYARDPNDPYGYPRLTNPGIANRHVCCLSLPFERNADSRFDANCGVAGGVGVCNQFPWITLTDCESGFFRSPPPPPGPPSRDGWIARVAIELSGVSDPLFRTDSARIVLATEPPPAGALPLVDGVCNGGWGDGGLVAWTYRFPGPNPFLDWWLYAIPRPLPSWRQQADDGPAVGLPGSRMVYDAARHVVLLAPGSSFQEWDGYGWRASQIAFLPGIAAIAFDSARNVVVAVTHPPTRTWEHDGTAWSLRTSDGPPVQQTPLMAFDEQRGVCVITQNLAPWYSLENQTWEWDGANWQLRHLGDPPPRYGAAMAYDRFNAELVLFGGALSEPGTSRETWTWDGTSWQLRDEDGPSAREAPGPAYDTVRRQVVLFGGHTETESFSDTWEWNGRSWQERAQVGPPGRGMPNMAYDDARQEIVIYGGVDWRAIPQVHYDDTWVYRVECPGDLDRDGTIGLSDLARLLSNFGQTNGANIDTGDLDNDGDVDLLDLSTMLAVFSNTCP